MNIIAKLKFQRSPKLADSSKSPSGYLKPFYSTKLANMLSLFSIIISVSGVCIGGLVLLDLWFNIALLNHFLSHDITTKTVAILYSLLGFISLYSWQKQQTVWLQHFEAEQALNKSKAKYKAIIEDQTELICRYSKDATVSYVNDAFCRYFGIKKEHIIDREYNPVIYEADRTKVACLIGSMDRQNPTVTVENRVIAKGKMRWTRWNNTMIFDSKGNFIEYQAVGRDITSLKEIEIKLQESEEKFRRAFEDAATGEALVNLDGQFLQVNQSLCEIVGYSESELLSKNFQEITHPDDLDLDVSYVQQMLAGTIRTYQMEKRYFHSQGHQVWVLLSVSMVKDIDDKPLYFISQIQDINQRKCAEAELNKLVKELERSNQELEEFASIVSHDLISPIRKQQMLVDLLKEDYGSVLKEEGKDYLQRMMQLNQRMEVLIRKLLTFARVNINSESFTKVAINEIVQNVIDELEPKIQQTKATIEIGKLPVVMGDRTQLTQLFQNLLQNALKFYSIERSLLIKIYSISSQNKPSQNFHQIVIADNGIGFESTEEENIFSPFYRLHTYNKYQGTGLGLAICQKIAENHQGEIKAQGTPDKGAKFTVFLPSSKL